MIAVGALIIGVLIGAVAVWVATMRSTKVATPEVNLRGIRWERAEHTVSSEALRHLRRNYPTHDLLTNCRFLDLVEVKGTEAAAANNRCAGWILPIVMIAKRNAQIDRIVLYDTDGDAEEKRWILRRLGFKVALVAEGGDETGVMQAMAA